VHVRGEDVDASFVARSCADKLRRLGSAQTDELADALRAGLKQAELQKRIAKVKRNSPTGKGFHGTHKLLMANTYWTQLHTTVKRCDVGEVKHKASMVAYSLITGLPFHASVVRSGQCNIDNDYDYDEDKDWCQLYLGGTSRVGLVLLFFLVTLTCLCVRRWRDTQLSPRMTMARRTPPIMTKPSLSG
jgi:hypothetical protein